MAMNGRANCILEICCRSNSAEGRKALADQIEEDLGCDKKEAHKYADWIRENFDLMPKGSTVQLKQEIAALARERRE